MSKPWRTYLAWSVVIVLLVVATWVGLYYALVGFPRTPMTKARADCLFGQALRSGQSRDAVQGWLASHRIPYENMERPEKELYRGSWLPSHQEGTVAECAGLELEKVSSVIRVNYPDAARGPFGHLEITVYLFFDSEGRLLRHWVDEFGWGL